MKLSIEYYYPTKDTLLKKIDIEVDPATLVKDLLASLRRNQLQDVTVPTRLALVWKGVSLQANESVCKHFPKDGDKFYLVEGRAQVNVVMLVNPAKGPQGGEKTVSLIFPTEGTCGEAVRRALQRNSVSTYSSEYRLIHEGLILSDYEILPCANQNIPTLHLQIGKVVYFDVGRAPSLIPLFVPLYQTPKEVKEILQAKQQLMFEDRVWTAKKFKFMPDESTVKLCTPHSMSVMIMIERDPGHFDCMQLKVEPSYTIKQVKHLIVQSKYEKLPKKTCDFYLEYHGEELTCEDNPLEYYNIKPGCRLMCEDYISITVKKISGETDIVKVTPLQNVLDFQHKYAQTRNGFCANLCRLIAAGGRQLEPGKTLADYGVSRGECTIQAVGRMCRRACENCQWDVVPCVGDGL